MSLENVGFPRQARSDNLGLTHPTESEIRHALEGNICRCTGYEMIVRSVLWAAEHGSAS